MKRKSSGTVSTTSESCLENLSSHTHSFTSLSEKVMMISLPFLTDALRPFLTLSETEEIIQVEQVLDLDLNKMFIRLTIQDIS